jgi:hypothetical protein
MKTFFYVLQKCIKSKKIIYPDEAFEINPVSNYDKDFKRVSLLIHLIISAIHYKLQKIKCKSHNKSQDYIQNYHAILAHVKFSILSDYLNNIFISNELKEKLLDVFSKSQRIYFALSKFVNMYRYKKWPLIVTNDLTLNPLDINHKATFVMIQNKSRYLFSMNDLINIVETAVSNAPNFFLHPLSPKNPYNNQTLNTSTLCNIYFKIREGNCKFSLIIHLFFLACFVKNDFYINNEPFLREYAIRKYIYTSPNNTLYNPVKIMLINNPYTNKLIIHNDFPKDLLVEIFKPYLFYHYIVNYDIKGTEKIYNYKNQLYIKLRKFYEYNKLFGRKILTGSRYKFIKSNMTYIFNTNHINFYNICTNNENLNAKIMTNINNITMVNRILNEYTTNGMYDPNELFYSNPMQINENVLTNNDSDESDGNVSDEDNNYQI